MLQNLFDKAHYRAQIAWALRDERLLQHFLTKGDARGLDPSPYFSTRFYKAQYPDWRALGATTAFADFLLRIGRGEDRRPHPLIDPAAYRAAYADLAGLGAGAALHFLQHGDAEGRSPSDLFDAPFYRRCYLPLGAGHAFRHYVTEGAAAGHLPRPAPKGAGASQAAMARQAAALPRPFLLVSHDAQEAGVPILTLDLAQAVRERGWSPVFLLGNAGPLSARFAGHGPVFILAEGWDAAGLARGLPRGTPAIVNTSAAAAVALPLVQAGLRTLAMVHEMPDFVRAHGFMPDLQAAVRAGARPVLSMPRMAGMLEEELGPADVITPGIRLAPVPLARFRAARGWRRRQEGPVFIGAGHADLRKGFDLFLQAAARIARERPTARFVWLGALDHWARALADAALEAGLSLTLPGFVADSLAWYRAADVYLLTSRQDPGPTTVAHAAAAGTPFVGYAADIGLVGLTDGFGTFVPSGDEAGFVAQALTLAESGTPERRRRIRRHILQLTSFDRYAEALISLAAGPAAEA